MWQLTATPSIYLLFWGERKRILELVMGLLTIAAHYIVPAVGLLSMMMQYITCFSDPGLVPLDVQAPTFHYTEPEKENIREHLPFKPRLEQAYAAKCVKCPGRPWKPPRAHHCKTCKRCVFKVAFCLTQDGPPLYLDGQLYRSRKHQTVLPFHTVGGSLLADGRRVVRAGVA